MRGVGTLLELQPKLQLILEQQVTCVVTLGHLGGWVVLARWTYGKLIFVAQWGRAHGDQAGGACYGPRAWLAENMQAGMRGEEAQVVSCVGVSSWAVGEQARRGRCVYTVFWDPFLG